VFFFVCFFFFVFFCGLFVFVCFFSVLPFFLFFSSFRLLPLSVSPFFPCAFQGDMTSAVPQSRAESFWGFA